MHYSSLEISEILNCEIEDSVFFEITNVSIDSRTVIYPKSTLFFALQGLSHDGHNYIASLYSRGVRNFVVQYIPPAFVDVPDAIFFKVTDTLQALQHLASWHRKHSTALVVGITGSNGKTIVKEWLYQMLSDEPGIYRSPRSYNSQVGVPLSLFGIDELTRLAIIEAGISLPGEMERLREMISPQIGIFTYLGDAHGENFSSKEEKLTEKAKLFKNCAVIIGKEGEDMDYLLSTVNRDVIGMLWGTGKNAVVKVNRLNKDANGREVEISYRRELFTLKVPFADEASFENSMNVITALLALGKSTDYICERINFLQPVAMRMEIKEGINNCILINDYYNLDAASFHLALNTLSMQDPLKNKVVILSDFVDSGINGKEFYRESAALLNDAGVSTFIGIGKKICEYRSYFKVSQSRFYPDTDSFLRQENRNNFHNEVILIKGARKFQFEYIAGFLQKQSHSTLLEVDLDAMVHNLNYFRLLIPQKTMISVMVKAFAYGSGMGEIANFLQYHGVDYLMVAFADEGVALRAAGITIPIAVMNPEQDAFDNMIEFNLEPEIYSLDLLRAFENVLAKHSVEKYPIHLKLNTGMNRSGIDEEEIPELLDFFKEKRNVYIRSVFSHLAGSDEAMHDDYTKLQAGRFIDMTNRIQVHFDYKIMRHLLNSAGIERFEQYSFDMVRLGIGLHGVSAIGAPLIPVSSFKTYIASARKVKAGQTVGYSRKGVLQRDSRIAVIPVGYADGLSRQLSRGVGEVWIKGKRAAIVGNVCMDSCMIDVTDIDVRIGDEVEIFGKHIPVTELADKLGTIPYEILTSVSQRVKRVYIKE